MKKFIFSLILFLLFLGNSEGSPPNRAYTYTAGKIISPTEVSENEDVIFSYLTTGVDTYADSSIYNADINSAAAITYSKLNLTGSILNADISSSAAIVYSKLSLGESILSTDIKDGEIVNADINASAAIVDSKLAQITTASKVSGAALTSFTDIPSGAGIIPTANLGSGSASASNFLRGDSSWAGAISQVNDTDAGTAYSTPATTFLSVNKTITSGNTVLLIASGYTTLNDATVNTFTLKQGSTTVQSVQAQTTTAGNEMAWSTCGIVTGLSGAVTFSVTALGAGTVYGNLVVMEF